MVYQWLVYGAIAVCVAGVGYRVLDWFRRGLDRPEDRSGLLDRLRDVAVGAGRVVLSRRVLTLGRAFVLDVLVQRRLFQAGALRWTVHGAIVAGFMILLLMHALDDVVMKRFFPGYEPTLNPYLFLRNAAGVMVLAGLAAVVWRRVRDRFRRVFTNRADVLLIALLAGVVGSGFLLEASKILSRSDFDRMVQDWAYIEDPAEMRAVEAYWVRELGLAPAPGRSRATAETLALGREVHELNCMGCHSGPASAFAGYGLSRVLRPAGAVLERAGAAPVLWWAHVLSALIGLALAPFTKMFHVIAAPLSLLVNAATDRDRLAPSTAAALRMLELDACTHCGACTAGCAVGVCFEALPNRDILPSEKIGELRRWSRNKPFPPGRRDRLREGLYICTNCTRCTGVCPSGIDLQDLWEASRRILYSEGPALSLMFSTLSFYGAIRGGDGSGEPLESATRALSSRWEEAALPGPLIARDGTRDGVSRELTRSLEGGSFSSCYRCSTCTNACPVVAAYDRPGDALGLLPHQIMHAAGLGLKDLLLNCGMLWYCLGCYQCQEHCPQGVRVTDVLYELKNMAMAPEENP
ncbi:MAG: 4Fe-4S dicluster domain-containing protein [Deltaproteobacteria bacterium]|nr:4Fe-4S dicluster domain-containing protein [Deltaproteobacteria bacterium]